VPRRTLTNLTCGNCVLSWSNTGPIAWQGPHLPRARSSCGRSDGRRAVARRHGCGCMRAAAPRGRGERLRLASPGRPACTPRPGPITPPLLPWAAHQVALKSTTMGLPPNPPAAVSRTAAAHSSSLLRCTTRDMAGGRGGLAGRRVGEGTGQRGGRRARSMGATAAGLGRGRASAGGRWQGRGAPRRRRAWARAYCSRRADAARAGLHAVLRPLPERTWVSGGVHGRAARPGRRDRGSWRGAGAQDHGFRGRKRRECVVARSVYRIHPPGAWGAGGGVRSPVPPPSFRSPAAPLALLGVREASVAWLGGCRGAAGWVGPGAGGGQGGGVAGWGGPGEAAHTC
jgi:hypothetical protein